jgi:hypothetical protein
LNNKCVKASIVLHDRYPFFKDLLSEDTSTKRTIDEIRKVVSKCYGLSHHYQQQRREQFHKDINEFVKILDECNCDKSTFHHSYTKLNMWSLFKSDWSEKCDHLTRRVTSDVLVMSEMMKIDHIACYIYAITGHKSKIHIKNKVVIVFPQHSVYFPVPDYLRRCKRSVITLLILAKRSKFPKDLAMLLAKQLWETQNEEEWE